MKSSLLLLIVCLGTASSFLIGNKGPEWTSLKVTWGANPFSKDNFVEQPLTIDDAKKDGFEQISSGCDGKYLGQRFIKNKDIGLVLIYDVQGTIAGVQMGIPASMVTKKYYNFTDQPMFNRDTIAGTDAFILTAYFADPKTICQSGRNAQTLKTIGTATGLWLQNGTDPIQDSVAAPLDETSAAGTKWVKGACFPTMGVHYWYDNRLDSDCDVFFPSFLMYNKGKLTGFGWDVVGKYEYTKRTEFPPLSAITSFLKPVPTCITQRYEDAGGFTTMHLYFTSNPVTLFC